MDAATWIRVNRNTLVRETPWELLFAETVLTAVESLDFATVTAQWAFKDIDGKSRRADFVIQESDLVKLVIEVDGFEYRRTNERFVDDNRREHSLIFDGWKVLRFPNSMFGRPGGESRPPEPREPGAADCARLISFELERLRSIANAVAATQGLSEEVVRLRVALRDANHELRQTREARDIAATAAQEAVQARRSLELQIPLAAPGRERLEADLATARAEVARTAAALAEREADLAGALAERERAEHGLADAGMAAEDRTTYLRLRRQHADQLAEAEGAVAQANEERRKDMRIALLAMAAVVVVALGAVVVLALRTPGSDAEAEPGVRASPVASTVVPERTRSITLQSLTSPVKAGDDARLRLVVGASSRCDIEYISPAGTASNARGLVPRTANAQGNIDWTWTIGSSTQPGQGTVQVDCDGSRAEWTFQVTR